MTRFPMWLLQEQRFVCTGQCSVTAGGVGQAQSPLVSTQRLEGVLGRGADPWARNRCWSTAGSRCSWVWPQAVGRARPRWSSPFGLHRVICVEGGGTSG